MRDAIEQRRIGANAESTSQRVFSFEIDVQKVRQQNFGSMHDLHTGKVRVTLDTPAPEPAGV